MKKGLAVILVLLVSLSLSARGVKEAQSDKVKAVLITDSTGIDDMSFNSAAWRGILEFYGDNGEGRGTLYEYIKTRKSDDYVSILKNTAEGDWDLIIVTESLLADALEAVAPLYSGKKFAIIDVNSLTPGDNLIEYVYEEEQGSYLVGVVAAEMAKADGVVNPKFGFVGGVAGATITKFEIGYIEGIKSVLPDAEIIEFYVNDWGDAASGKRAARSMYDQGVYAVFTAAGESGLGVIEEAKEERLSGKNVWAVGVDSDQYEEGIYADGKSAVLTSMIKVVENSVIDALRKVDEGRWIGGEVVGNLANGGVGYTKTNPELKSGVIDAVDKAREGILDGRIVVSKTYAESLGKGIAPEGLKAVDD